MMWGLCFLCVAGGFTAVHGAPAGRPRKTEDKAAPQEEVNVLMFGVIQLSESLNYVYENTEAKIAKISQTVRGHEGALRQLGAQTEQAAEVERQMREVIRLLQAQVATQQAQTRTAEDRIAQIQQQEVELQGKVTSLEEDLNNMFPASIKELQDRAAENAVVLRGLQHLTEYQKENMETHDKQLSALLKMSEALP